MRRRDSPISGTIDENYSFRPVARHRPPNSAPSPSRPPPIIPPLPLYSGGCESPLCSPEGEGEGRIATGEPCPPPTGTEIYRNGKYDGAGIIGRLNSVIPLVRNPRDGAPIEPYSCGRSKRFPDQITSEQATYQPP